MLSILVGGLIGQVSIYLTYRDFRKRSPIWAHATHSLRRPVSRFTALDDINQGRFDPEAGRKQCWMSPTVRPICVRSLEQIVTLARWLHRATFPRINVTVESEQQGRQQAPCAQPIPREQPNPRLNRKHLDWLSRWASLHCQRYSVIERLNAVTHSCTFRSNLGDWMGPDKAANGLSVCSTYSRCSLTKSR